MGVKNRTTLYKLIFAWVMYFVFIKTDFASKESHADAVLLTQGIYIFFFLSLVLLTFFYIKQLLKK